MRKRVAPTDIRIAISLCREAIFESRRFDIHAGDEQQQANRAEQDPQSIRDPCQGTSLRMSKANPPVLRKLGWVALLRSSRRRSTQVGLGFRDSRVGLKTAQQVNLAFSLHFLPAMENIRQVHIRAAPHESLRMTPITDRTFPFSFSLRPSTPVSPPNCCCQNL